LHFTEIYFSQRLIKSKMKRLFDFGKCKCFANILMDINKREEIDWIDRKG